LVRSCQAKKNKKKDKNIKEKPCGKSGGRLLFGRAREGTPKPKNAAIALDRWTKSGVKIPKVG